MADKKILSRENTKRIEAILQKASRPMTSGSIMTFIKTNSNLLPELLASEGVAEATFQARIVNTAKHGLNNKIAVMRHQRTRKPILNSGSGYLLQFDQNKLNYTPDDLALMKHHNEGKRKSPRRTSVRSSNPTPSTFVGFISGEATRFEALMETICPDDWTCLSLIEKKSTFINYASNVKGELKKLIFEGINTVNEPSTLQVVGSTTNQEL